jgi:thiol-disulfide isomerase/thioredoxin
MMSRCIFTRLTAGLCLLLATLAVQAAEPLSVIVNDEELAVVQYPADGDDLLLFVSSGMGSLERGARIAEQLAARGLETWHVDLAESLFLPRGVSTLRGLDGRYVAGLIEQAHARSGKRVTLLTRSYASIPVLRGARLWQLEQQQRRSVGQPVEAYLNGAILISPELASTIAELGLEPVYAPITRATNLPVMILQAGKRSNRWQLERVVAQLEQGGSRVYVKLLPGVTGMFYEEDDSEATRRVLQTIPADIATAVGLLARHEVLLNAQPLLAESNISGPGIDTGLRPYRGDPQPKVLDLYTADGQRVVHDDYRGKITVVNFWATWCAPCVEEIPSLNRLRQQMEGLPFELISVDYAEEAQRIEKFLDEVDVHFPVLLDSDGRVSADWNVLVFPSTFVVGPDGRIAYGVRGAIHWDSPEVIAQLKALLERK